MNKQDFLSQLGKQLTGFSARQARETLDYYAEMIDDRMEDGMTEEEAVSALGSPDLIAREILEDMPAVPKAIAKTWRKSTVLLAILAILGSPLWISLGLAFLALLAAGYLVIWSLALVIWVLGGALAICGLALPVVAWAGVMTANYPFALAFTGAGLCLIGLGALICFVALMVSKLIAKLSATWVKKMLSPFSKSPLRSRPCESASPNGALGAFE